MWLARLPLLVSRRARHPLRPGLYAARDQRTTASAIRSQDRRRLKSSARAAAARRFAGIAVRTTSTARLPRRSTCVISCAGFRPSSRARTAPRSLVLAARHELDWLDVESARLIRLVLSDTTPSKRTLKETSLLL